MDLLIKNAFVVTMNDQNEIYARADVAVKDNRIVYVGPPKDWDPSNIEKVIDGTEMIVIPGLINSHIHPTQNLIRGMVHRLPLEI